MEIFRINQSMRFAEKRKVLMRLLLIATKSCGVTNSMSHGKLLRNARIEKKNNNNSSISSRSSSSSKREVLYAWLTGFVVKRFCNIEMFTFLFCNSTLNNEATTTTQPVLLYTNKHNFSLSLCSFVGKTIICSCSFYVENFFIYNKRKQNTQQLLQYSPS